MKHLVLIRHAKSSWKDAGLRDIERPLNKRGLRDAPEAGRRLKGWGMVPDRVLCSPAVRARMTAGLLLAELGLDERVLDVRDEIYGASADGLLGLVSGLDDALGRVFLVGHNPDLTLLARRVAFYPVENLPTCAMFGVSFACRRWAELPRTLGTLQFFDFPRKHPTV